MVAKFVQIGQSNLGFVVSALVEAEVVDGLEIKDDGAIGRGDFSRLEMAVGTEDIGSSGQTASKRTGTFWASAKLQAAARRGWLRPPPRPAL